MQMISASEESGDLKDRLSGDHAEDCIIHVPFE